MLKIHCLISNKKIIEFQTDIVQKRTKIEQ